jgi:hypothetical protein
MGEDVLLNALRVTERLALLSHTLLNCLDQVQVLEVLLDRGGSKAALFIVPEDLIALIHRFLKVAFGQELFNQTFQIDIALEGVPLGLQAKLHSIPPLLELVHKP